MYRELEFYILDDFFPSHIFEYYKDEEYLLKKYKSLLYRFKDGIIISSYDFEYINYIENIFGFIYDDTNDEVAIEYENNEGKYQFSWRLDISLESFFEIIMSFAKIKANILFNSKLKASD